MIPVAAIRVIINALIAAFLFFCEQQVPDAVAEASTALLETG